MGAFDELQAQTNASQNDVVRAFKESFFEPPGLSDHFKPTPIAHFRSQMTWSPTQVMDSAVAAKLVQVNFNRTLEDLDHYRSETGETIALAYDESAEGATVRIWVDREPMIVGHDVTNPLVFHSYAQDIFSRLQQDGFKVQSKSRLDGYHVPPGAPPGWPFPS
jgi:hypothetical protein